MTKTRVFAALAASLALASCGSVPNYCFVSDQAQYQRTALRQATASPRLDFAVPRVATPKLYDTADRFTAPAPDVGSPEWQRQQAEAARRDQQLDRNIRGICRGC